MLRLSQNKRNVGICCVNNLTSFKLYGTNANIVVVPCKRTQHVGPNNVACCWQTILRPFGWTVNSSIFKSNWPYQKRWRLYILPQYLTNLTQPVGIEKAVYSCDIHPCTVTTLCIDDGCTFYHKSTPHKPNTTGRHRESCILLRYSSLYSNNVHV